MGVRWLVNAGLLALPVGTTVGVLLGIDIQRQSTGQEPIFNNPDNGLGGGGGSGGGPNVDDDRVTDELHCAVQVGVSPPSQGVEFMLNPNQWGYTPGEPGGMCMNITSFNNGTYATPSTAPPFSVTWAYPPGPASQPVHAFPNVQVWSDLPTTPVSTIRAIDIDLHWTYGVGNTPAVTTDIAAMNADAANTNVAIDMFLDANKDNAKNSSLAHYEIMVWFAAFGAATQPIGIPNGIQATQIINGTTFNLYTGQNGLRQNVLTWLASTQTETFTGDIAPLITSLDTVPDANFTGSSLYMGHLGMGSEAFSATENVTFSVPLYSIAIRM